MMSLDVYLASGEEEFEECIYCQGAGKRSTGREYDFSMNITHNLNRMAGEAGIYKAVWRPEEVGISKAGQLIEPLAKGIELMRSDPERFKKFNPSNGWGDYDTFLSWLERYLSECINHPDAEVSTCR